MLRTGTSGKPTLSKNKIICNDCMLNQYNLYFYHIRSLGGGGILS